MVPAPTVKVKGGALLSRFAFVRDQIGEDGLQRVLARLSEADRAECARIHTGGWYPFALNERIDSAIAAEVGLGDDIFLLMGEKSAIQNLTGAHRAMVSDGDPHGLLRRTPQIYQMYYDAGRRTYEKTGERSAVLRTYDAPTFSLHDCLTVVGWHRKAIAMCGGRKASVVETKCRARGGELCEYVCSWM
ncbi:MAG TPA: DUF2378 family protein [Thermoanaerobaculia bacterium]|nr:DUF2378 family protein [Thermoanaerobaculia bacterium]